ncbi:membrane protein of unknown function [Candidatus Promineifilum breve]|uniref:Uncharacterized protein n=1 Tax=Candidatus Promineifilum breve TaxID=1806508 RepID=A0A160T6A4_9CHLR|nr:membrane protein of unknown function [Candidatus Promineifilum breve]
MAKNLVEIIVTAEDKASGVLKGIGGSLRSVGAVALGGLGIATGAVVGLGAAVVGLAQDAAALPGLTSAFGELTSTMEGGSAGMIAALQDSSGGLITNTELMRSFNTAAALVGNDFAEVLPDAMGYLSKVSAATGQDMGFMLDSLVKGVGRLSPMILDNLGIQVNLTEANEIYAKSVGKSADELTKAEQQTALMNQVMEKLAANTEGMDGMSDPFKAFQVTLQNVKDEIGAKLLPAITPLMNKFSALTQRIIPPLMEKVDAFVGVLSKISGVILAFVGNLESGMSPLDAFIDAMSGILPPEMLAGLIDFRDNVLPGLMMKFYDLRDSVVTLITPVLEAIGQFVSWKDVLIAAAVGIAAIVLPIIWSLITAMAPILLTIAAVIAVVALLRNAWENNWGGIQEKTAAVWATIQPVIQAIKDWLEVNIPVALEFLRSMWVDTVWPAIQNAIAVVWPIIQQIFTAIVTFVTGSLIPTLQMLWQKWTVDVWPVIQTVTQNVWTIIKAIFEELGRWINDNIVPWIEFLHQKWANEVWPAIQTAVANAWNVIRPIWEALKEWVQVTLPNALRPLQGIFEGVMGGISAAITPVKQAWEGFVGAVQGFWDWIKGKVFDFQINLPDLPAWALPGSPLPIHTAWKAFGAEMDRIGGQLAGGFDVGLGAVGATGAAAMRPVATGGGTHNVTVNIDARGAARGVDTDLRRMIEDVMREYGGRADVRMRTGY